METPPGMYLYENDKKQTIWSAYTKEEAYKLVKSKMLSLEEKKVALSKWQLALKDIVSNPPTKNRIFVIIKEAEKIKPTAGKVPEAPEKELYTTGETLLEHIEKSSGEITDEINSSEKNAVNLQNHLWFPYLKKYGSLFYNIDPERKDLKSTASGWKVYSSRIITDLTEEQINLIRTIRDSRYSVIILKEVPKNELVLYTYFEDDEILSILSEMAIEGLNFISQFNS